MSAPEPAPRSLLRSFLRWSLIAAGLGLGSVFAILVVRPEVLLFHPSPDLARTPDAIGWAYEALTLETEDGEQISAWYLEGPAASGDDPGGGLGDGRPSGLVALYLHGNAGNMGGRLAVLEGLRALGLSVLIIDYRGFGDSSGRPTVPGTHLDARAAWDHLVEVRGYAPGQIVVWGRSLGGAVAIERAAAASEAGTPPAALVVESTFTSTIDIGLSVYPWLPIRRLGAKIDYPSLARIAAVAAPLLLAHSPDDDLIPPSHGDALFEAARSTPSATFEALDGGHNDGRLTDPDHRDAARVFLRALPVGPH